MTADMTESSGKYRSPKQGLWAMLIFGTLLLLPHTAAAGRPCGLMTDLLRNTGTVCIGGYPSDITLNDLPAAVESVQYAEVLSRRPSFGWIVPGERNATRQTAYRIRLYEYGQKSPLWDSGKVDGDRSVAVGSGRYDFEIRVRQTGGKTEKH